MYCPHCGTNVPGTAFSGPCPACGRLPSELPADETAAAPIAPEDEATRLDAAPPRTPLPPSRTPTPPPLGSPAHSAVNGSLAQGLPTPGQGFGPRYQIIRLLGSGGMGAVYQAWDDELDEAVALKIIRPEVSDDPDAARDLERRFKRELQLARQVTHKNVVRIHDLGEINGIKYLTMPYLQGVDLSTVLKRDGKLSVARTIAIACQVTAGLRAAHEAGIVHRDLKPANIMIDADDRAVIMDFGIARSVTGPGERTVAGAVVGTLAYMAPEQARGEAVDQRTDIYAFGLILRDMLLGRRVGSRTESAVSELMGRIQAPLPPVRPLDASVPEALDQLITRCTEPDPAARFQTSAELAAALEIIAEPGGQTGRTLLDKTPLGRPPTGRHTTQRVAWLPPAARSWKVPAAAALVLLALGSWMFHDRLPFGPTETTAGSVHTTSLAILPFRNATGDQSLDWLGSSLGELLRSEVGQSAQLRTVAPDRVHQILTDLRLSPSAPLDEPTLQRIAEFSNSPLLVSGQYFKMGESIRIEASVHDRGRERPVVVRVEAPRESELLPAIQELARSIRQNLALAPDIVAELRANPFTPSSKSLPAIRSYNEGLQLGRQGEYLEAAKQFEAAVKADPQFALAHSKLGQTYAQLGHVEQGEQASSRAVELSADLPTHERYLVEANHARLINDHAKAISSFENLAKVSPDNDEVLFNLGMLYEDTAAFDDALDRFNRLLERDPKHVNALLATGRVAIRKGAPGDALDPLNRALTLAIQMDNDEQKATVLHAIGVAYKRLAKPDEALRYYRESLDIKRRINNERGVAVSLNEMAQVQDSLGRSEEALASYTEALALRRKLGDTRGVGDTLIDLGMYYQDRGDGGRALQLFKESLQIQRQAGNDHYEALCLNNIGNIYLAMGEYNDALTNFERALTLREKINVPREVADSLHDLGTTHSRMGQYDEALAYYLRALELRRTAGDRRGAAIDSYRMGGVFELQGRLGAAVTSKGEALKSMRELGDRGYWLAEMLSGYGSALAQVGRGSEAEESLKEALQLARDLSNRPLIAQALNFQADRLLYAGDAKPARALFEQALQAASETADRYLVLRARMNLAKVDVEVGRPKAAAAALRGLAKEADALGLKHLSVECSTLLAQALLDLKDVAGAKSEIDSGLKRAGQLGSRTLLAKGHYVGGMVLKAQGDGRRAAEHFTQARQILDETRREAGSDSPLKRADLGRIYEDSTRWSAGPSH